MKKMISIIDIKNGKQAALFMVCIYAVLVSVSLFEWQNRLLIPADIDSYTCTQLGA